MNSYLTQDYILLQFIQRNGEILESILPLKKKVLYKTAQNATFITMLIYTLQLELTLGTCFIKPHKKMLSLGPDQWNAILLILYFRIIQFFQNFQIRFYLLRGPPYPSGFIRISSMAEHLIWFNSNVSNIELGALRGI